MKRSEELLFNLFANCIPVKGSNRSIICDVYRKRFKIIPNSLYFILTRLKKYSLKEIKRFFENEKDDYIEDYFSFLVQNEFGFYCTKQEQKLFPALNLEYEIPSIISNCIIDVNKNSTHNYRKLFLELEELNCHYWKIRIYDNLNLSEIETIFSATKDIHLHSIHLLLPYDKSMAFAKVIKFYNLYPISQIDFHSVPLNIVNDWKRLYKKYPFRFYNKNISNEKHCGIVNDYYFNPDLKLFSESQHKNSCLNQKIGIDTNGEIKNCPSLAKSYGNIKNTTLLQAIEKKGFKELWSINKDKINVCKDCEFRHICTDCRAYVENPNDIYSKPLKCGYNPYTSKWEEWSKNPMKKEAIAHFEMKECL